MKLRSKTLNEIFCRNRTEEKTFKLRKKIKFYNSAINIAFYEFHNNEREYKNLLGNNLKTMSIQW